MKISFTGSLAEFHAVFGGGIFELEDSQLGEDTENLVAQELSYDSSPSPTFVQDVPDAPPIGESTAIPFPQNKSFSGDVKKLTPSERIGCVEASTYFFQEWVKGFQDDEADQPNRVELIETMGSGQWTVPFLVLCYEYGSLQKFCGVCLREDYRDQYDSEADWWEWIDLVACNIVQVSVAGFPDVQGTYDYSTRWKREALGEA